MMYDHLKTVDDVKSAYDEQVERVIEVRKMLSLFAGDEYLCMQFENCKPTLHLPEYPEFEQRLKKSLQKLFDDELFKIEQINNRLRFIELEEEK